MTVTVFVTKQGVVQCVHNTPFVPLDVQFPDAI